MPDTTTGVLGLPNIFWAPGTDPGGEGLSYEQLKQRRAIAAALASRARPYPTTIGQGIASLGESFGDAMYEKRTQEYEKAQRDLDRAAREEAGGVGVTPPPPAAPRGRTSAVTEEAVKTAAALDEKPNPVSTMVADASPASRVDLARTVLAGQGIVPPGAAGVSPEPTPSQPTAAPLRTRYAALNTGPTMSDAGQPGATYGGPSPAGPGASMAEPPVASPPTPSALPTAPPGPAGTPAPGVAGGGPGTGPGRADLAGSVLAQAGVTPPVPGRAPTRVPTVRPLPPPAIQQAPGNVTQPPPSTAPSPETYLDPGQTRMNDPQHYGERPPKPLVGQDTPEMASIKRVLADPRYRNISPPQREQMMEGYRRLKETRDKQDSENLTEWNRLDADWLARKKEYEENIRTAPKQRLELSKEQAAEIDRQRFGSPENKKFVTEGAIKSAKDLKQQADQLPMLYEAEKLLKSGNIIAGQLTTSPGSIPGIGLPLPGKLDAYRFGGALGQPQLQKMVEDTEYFNSQMAPQLGAMLARTSPRGAISEKEGEVAKQAVGLDPNLTVEAKLRIVQRLREETLRSIAQHNSQVRDTFKLPQTHDRAVHSEAIVNPKFDPADVEQLFRFGRGIPRPQERAIFDQMYGPGASERAIRERGM